MQPILDAITPHIAPALLVIFRVGGLMIYGPVFGSPAVPVRVKVLLSFLIGLAIYPTLDAVALQQPHIELSLWSLGPMIAAEALIGLVIGYVASIPLLAAQTGGLVMGQQMGLGFARFFNPAVDDEADVVGQVLFFMALTGFVLLGGHEMMVLGVLHSFDHIALGGFRADISVIELITGLMIAAFEIALRISAPLLALIFLESVAMGFVSKTVPQLNILSLGFPVRILVGFAIIGLGLVVIDEVMMEGVNDAMSALFDWMELSPHRTPADIAGGG